MQHGFAVKSTTHLAKTSRSAVRSRLPIHDRPQAPHPKRQPTVHPVDPSLSPRRCRATPRTRSRSPARQRGGEYRVATTATCAVRPPRLTATVLRRSGEVQWLDYPERRGSQDTGRDLTSDTQRKSGYPSLAPASASTTSPFAASADPFLRSAQYFFIRSDVACLASADMLRRFRAGFAAPADVDRPGFPPRAEIAASIRATLSSNSVRSD